MNRKTLWKLLALLVILAGGVSWYFFWPREDAGRHTVSVAGLSGTALVERSGMKISAYEGMKLKDGDSICAVSGQEVILGIDGIPFAVLEPGTELSIKLIKEETNGTQIQMEEGSVLFLSGATLSGSAPKQAAELLLSAGGLQIDANGASFYITVQEKEGATHTELSVWSGRVMAVPLAGGKEESVAAGMTASYLLNEIGVSSKGQKAFTLWQFSEHVLEKLLAADRAQSPFCVSREELVRELEEREAIAAGSTNLPSAAVSARLTPEGQAGITPLLSGQPPVSGKPEPSGGTLLTPEPASDAEATPNPTPDIAATPMPVVSPIPSMPTLTDVPPVTSTEQPSPLPTQSAWASATPMPTSALPVTSDAESELANRFAQLIGQTPKEDPDDGVFTYYEFATGMLAAAEPKLAASGTNMETVLVGFAFRLITGGVDINRLDVNDPITREDAALFIWYGAQCIGYAPASAEIAAAAAYVEDIAKCTLPRQKAIGFLYQEGYEEGYQKSGQKFRPQDILTTEEGESWVRTSAELWKPE